MPAGTKLNSPNWKAQSPSNGHGLCVTNIGTSGHDEVLRKIVQKEGLTAPKLAGAGRGGMVRFQRTEQQYVSVS